VGDTRGNLPAGRGPLDAARGRSDPRPELHRKLAAAPAAYLEGALSNPELDEEGAALLVKSPHAPSAVLVRVGRSTRWTRVYEVKRGLTRHPRSPLPLARRFLPHLLWLDLAEAAADTRLSAVVRRYAEEALKTRLLDMAEGEIVALARRASPGVVAELTRSRSPQVLAALLSNLRCGGGTWSDCVRGGASRYLRRMVHLVPVGRRRAVRVALLRNPHAGGGRASSGGGLAPPTSAHGARPEADRADRRRPPAGDGTV
jgi:hypothetical protein